MIAVRTGIFLPVLQQYFGARHAPGGCADDDGVRYDVPAGKGFPRSGDGECVRPWQVDRLPKSGDFACRKVIARRCREQAERLYPGTVFLQGVVMCGNADSERAGDSHPGDINPDAVQYRYPLRFLMICSARVMSVAKTFCPSSLLSIFTPYSRSIIMASSRMSIESMPMVPPTSRSSSLKSSGVMSIRSSASIIFSFSSTISSSIQFLSNGI